MTPKKQDLPDMIGPRPYELTEAVAACLAPAQVQTRWCPGIEKGKWTLVPIPNHVDTGFHS